MFSSRPSCSKFDVVVVVGLGTEEKSCLATKVKENWMAERKGRRSYRMFLRHYPGAVVALRPVSSYLGEGLELGGQLKGYTLGSFRKCSSHFRLDSIML